MRLGKKLLKTEFEDITYKEVLKKVIREHKKDIKASIEEVDKAVKFFENEYGI